MTGGRGRGHEMMDSGFGFRQGMAAGRGMGGPVAAGPIAPGGRGGGFGTVPGAKGGVAAVLGAWQYRDATGQVQGPCAGVKLLEWYAAGVFTEGMLVKPTSGTTFVPLREAFDLAKGTIRMQVPPQQQQQQQQQQGVGAIAGGGGGGGGGSGGGGVRNSDDDLASLSRNSEGEERDPSLPIHLLCGGLVPRAKPLDP